MDILPHTDHPGEFAPAVGGERWTAATPARLVSDNGAPRSLVEAIDDEARAYRAQGTPVGDFLARQIERLAQLARWTNSATPEEYEDRLSAWDNEIQAQHYDRGYSDGIAAARRELSPYLAD